MSSPGRTLIELRRAGCREQLVSLIQQLPASLKPPWCVHSVRALSFLVDSGYWNSWKEGENGCFGDGDGDGGKEWSVGNILQAKEKTGYSLLHPTPRSPCRVPPPPLTLGDMLGGSTLLFALIC